MNQKIFLIGLPGSGKTTSGLDLAHKLGIQFVDLDQEIEKESKQTVTEIFEQKGEAHFRQLEKLHLEKIIASVDMFVMATGGGTPCFFNNLNTMKQVGTVFYLDTPVEEIQRRLMHDTSRPLLRNNRLEELLASRKKWYNQADHTIQEYKEILTLLN